MITIKISRAAFQELAGAFEQAGLERHVRRAGRDVEDRIWLGGDRQASIEPLPETPSQPADKHVPPTDELAREHYVAHKQDEIVRDPHAGWSEDRF